MEATLEILTAGITTVPSLPISEPVSVDPLGKP